MPGACRKLALAGWSAACLAGWAHAAAAQDTNPMPLVRTDRWAEAQMAAAGNADPVAAKLVLFYRLLTPHQASLAELDAFMAANPDWPLHATLARRREEALAVEADAGAVLAACASQPRLAAALQRCGDAETARQNLPAAQADWRAAYVALPADRAQEAAFLAVHPNLIAEDDAWQRFDRLAWAGSPAAAALLPRLSPAHRAVAQARLALQANTPDCDGLVAALPAATDPGLRLAQLKRLRHAGQDAAALALIQSLPPAPPDHQAAFWAERNQLIRQLLHDNDAQNAYALAANPGEIPPEAQTDAQFLAGWIALRRLHDPARAAGHFTALAGLSGAVITQSRAHYWLGRAALDRGDQASARAEYARAAMFPTTFYGQLAALALDPDTPDLAAKLRAARDPEWDQQRALRFTGRELTRAAALLTAWNEPHRARVFLTRLQDITPDPADKALAARLANGLALPDEAVAIARLAGRDGVALPETGWPRPYTPAPDTVDPALALAIMRQESNFDPDAASPVGARGLMQLMPATARQVAQQIALPMAPLTDPDFNIRLGSTYLRGLMDRFGQEPMAVAAYNAGPHRVDGWLQDNGAPGTPGFDMIDWIEQIPFNETRNYVQRVTENLVIYRAQRHDSAPHPLTPWLK